MVVCACSHEPCPTAKAKSIETDTAATRQVARNLLALPATTAELADWIWAGRISDAVRRGELADSIRAGPGAELADGIPADHGVDAS